MIKLAIGGSRGRMGQRVEALAADDERFRTVGRYDVGVDAEEGPFEVLADFSAPKGTMKFISLCRQKGAGLRAIVGSASPSPATPTALS